MALAFVGSPCKAAPAPAVAGHGLRHVPLPSFAPPLAAAAVAVAAQRRNRARITIRSQGATKYTKLVEEDRMITIEETSRWLYTDEIVCETKDGFLPKPFLQASSHPDLRSLSLQMAHWASKMSSEGAGQALGLCSVVGVEPALCRGCADLADRHL